MTYRVTSPLVIAPDDDGVLKYHYHGAEVESIDAEAAKRLVSEGLIEKVKASASSTRAQSSKQPAAKTTAPKKDATAPAAGGKLPLPPFTAPDEDWVAYAIQEGMDPEDAKTTPRQDLIAKYAQQ
ncbi:hypothetical protein SEA_DOGGS_7 [Gordonia phage Doggs]|nr:hypothetical protein SEA_DOGGS_7 [Gordonia phage Doggs]